MKPNIKPPCTILATALAAALHAAVPVAWTNSPGMPPYPIKPVPHGSTVDLAVTLKGYTTPPIADGADVRLWYQTNGMGQAWWSAPATFDGSTITASFGPAQDCGADRVSLFFGAPSNVFASAVLRLTHAPGFAPASLPLPVPVLDFATVELRNFSALTNGWSFGSTPGNYSVVSNAAVNAAPKYKSKFNCQWVYYDGIRHLLSGGEPWEDAIAMWGHSHLPRLSNCTLEYLGAGVWRFYTGSATPEPDYKVVTNSEDAVVLDFGGNYLLTKTNDVQSAVVYSDELPPAISNVVTKSYVENLGISSEVEESDPVWSADKPNYATKSDTAAIATASTNYTDEAVGRIDVPEWPIELVHTNLPLICAEGQDTNVTSIALRAQPTDYTSISFMFPASYYLPNRFSLLELGNDYQIVGSQWFQVSRFLYARNPENIVFVGGGRHKTLQEYLDACAPETLSDLLSSYVPTNGGGRIHGDLVIDGELKAGSLVTITNSDIIAKGFSVIDKVLTADGLFASNGMVRLNCARFVLGFGTPRIHLETNTLDAITYGGTWDDPVGSMRGLVQTAVETALNGDEEQQSYEEQNPYVRYKDVRKRLFDWDLKPLPVNAGPLKHFDLENCKTHYFTDADVGRHGIEYRIHTNTHVRVVHDFETSSPSVYIHCYESVDHSATILSNGSEFLYPTTGQRTLFEIEPLSNGTFIVKETALPYLNNVSSLAAEQYDEEDDEP